MFNCECYSTEDLAFTPCLSRPIFASSHYWTYEQMVNMATPIKTPKSNKFPSFRDVVLLTYEYYISIIYLWLDCLCQLKCPFFQISTERFNFNCLKFVFGHKFDYQPNCPSHSWITSLELSKLIKLVVCTLKSNSFHLILIELGHYVLRHTILP